MKRPLYLTLALLVVVLAVYANHFFNDFHFDDQHTITQNPAIANLGNLPRFFTDARLFSVMPNGQTWRPVVATSLAIDYWIAGGAKPFAFHLSTFFWYLVQLVLMFYLFRRIMDAAALAPANLWAALAATACYGLHPAMAETVNYIIQRGDLYDTLGVVASLVLFIVYPAKRKYLWYMLPAIAAYMSKAPALVFPFILLAYVYLFERDSRPPVWPAFAITGVFAVLTRLMTPAGYNPGATSASLYRLTQPWIALHYFKVFFLPTDLSADTDWTYVDPLGVQAWAGYLFVAALVAVAWYTARRREMRPIAFGIVWFILALLPTSLLPLAEVTNDHRMFFPFVGLALSAIWSLWLILPLPYGRGSATILSRDRKGAVAIALLTVLALEAAGTWQRNLVWHTEESLWRDVTLKSPKNGRGWENYGNIFLARGDIATALPYLKLAAQYSHGDTKAINLTLEHNLQMALGDETARKYLGERAEAEKLVQAANAGTSGPQAANAGTAVGLQAANAATATQALVNLSAEYWKSGKYEECIATAQQALRLRPDSAEAYNNMAAAYFSLQRWDEGIVAERKALALKPDYEDARSNLDWALKHRPKAPSTAK